MPTSQQHQQDQKYQSPNFKFEFHWKPKEQAEQRSKPSTALMDEWMKTDMRLRNSAPEMEEDVSYPQQPNLNELPGNYNY